ncbi:hypothetical protein BY996DRAFT_6924059 [Phakopsora pachyrhizi]|nr:hypothetical protein BY996DRAFT_6924059 [Phakopsora pachyrhizi]
MLLYAFGTIVKNSIINSFNILMMICVAILIENTCMIAIKISKKTLVIVWSLVIVVVIFLIMMFRI